MRLHNDFRIIWIYAGFFSFLFDELQAQCIVSFRLDSSSPLLIKNFGTQELILKRDIEMLTINENDTLRTHCSNGHVFKSRYCCPSEESTPVQILNWRCEKTKLYMIEAPNNLSLDALYERNFEIGCQTGSKQQIYVSNISLPYCNNATTLIVGSQFGENTNLKTVAICYDLEQLRLNYVSYIAYPNKNILNKAELNISNDLEALELDNVLYDFGVYFDFVRQTDFDNAKFSIDKHKLYKHFDTQLFEYESLIQDTPLLQDLSPYDYVFNIIWYKNLRLGNWRNFLDALLLHTTTDGTNYQIRLGTSGSVNLPISSSCLLTEPLIFNATKKLMTPAKYIWAHLHELNNGTTSYNEIPKNNHEEFVLVAINTPYVNLADPNNFCASICSEIPWLQSSPFGTLHLMSIYGVVLCCRVADVANKLNGFPYTITDSIVSYETTTDDAINFSTDFMYNEIDIN